jgi:hypothetical protein
MVLEVRIPVYARDVSSKTSIPALRPIQPPVWVPEVKQPGYKVHHSFPSSVDANYECNCVCIVFTSKCMFEKQVIQVCRQLSDRILPERFLQTCMTYAIAECTVNNS